MIGSKKLNIIDLYKRYKEKCVDYINIEFSFVIYDEKKESYFAARDVIGFKPLYYTVTNNQIFFSRDIETLFKESNVKKELNLETMSNIIDHRSIAHDATMYKNIKRLPAGHYMFVDKNAQCNIVRYWKPENIKIDKSIGKEEAKEKFSELFDKAIFDRIDDIKTTGFELSGGLDSSSIVSWVKHKKPQEKITALAMKFSSMKRCNEDKYLDAMTNKYDINLQNIATDKMDYKNEYSLENNYKLNPTWPIFITYTMGFSIIEKARELGVKTILTGQGGDHVLTGNLYVLQEYLRNFQWFQLYKELKVLPNSKTLMKRYFIVALVGEKNTSKLRVLYRRLKGKKELENKSNVKKPTFEEFFELYEGNSPSFKEDITQVLHSNISALMESSYYRVAESKYGIEFKHPYFDRRLIEFMLSLPPKFKYSEGLTKRVLRDAMKGILPEKIRLRKSKAEFSEVLRQQIDAIDLETLLSNSYLASLGLVEQKVIDRYKEDYLNGKLNRVVYFWILINLEYWYRYNFISNNKCD